MFSMVLIVKLVLSIVLIVVGAILTSRLLNKHWEVGYVGLAVFVWVAGNLIWHGGHAVIRYFSA